MKSLSLNELGLQSIPDSKLSKIWGGATAATQGGNHTAGSGSPYQYSFTYTSDTVEGAATHFNGQNCTDGCADTRLISLVWVPNEDGRLSSELDGWTLYID